MKRDLSLVGLPMAIFFLSLIEVTDLSDSKRGWRYTCALIVCIVFGVMFLAALIVYFRRPKIKK